VVTALQIAQGLDSDKQYVQMRNKIESMVPDRQRQQLRAMQQGLVVDVVPWRYGPEFEMRLAEIQGAIADHCLLAFSYISGKGEILSRECEPHKLVFKGRTWYLYAFCLLRKDFRLFRLSRIRDFRVLEQTFAPRENADHEKALSTAWSDPQIPTTTFVMRFAPAARAWIEDFVRNNGEIEHHEDGGYTVKMELAEDEWVYGFILSFNGLLELLEPAHARKIIRKKAQALADRHG
jgi:predicted DNA-binding transcriptional regulator YafY